ncbi:hypothetical protein ACOSQ4_027584 [Xanthoceras sorbifolium]
MRAIGPPVRSRGGYNFRGGSKEAGYEKENLNPNVTVNRGVGAEAFSKQCPPIAECEQRKDNIFHASDGDFVSRKVASVLNPVDVVVGRNLNSSIPYSSIFSDDVFSGVVCQKSTQELESKVELSFKENLVEDAEKDFTAIAMVSSVFSVVLNSKILEVSSCGVPFLRDVSGDFKAQNSATGPEAVGEEGAEVSSTRITKWKRLARVKFKGVSVDTVMEGLREADVMREKSPVKKHVLDVQRCSSTVADLLSSWSKKLKKDKNVVFNNLRRELKEIEDGGGGSLSRIRELEKKSDYAWLEGSGFYKFLAEG